MNYAKMALQSLERYSGLAASDKIVALEFSAREYYRSYGGEAN